jgi:hypothetical protein
MHADGFKVFATLELSFDLCRGQAQKKAMGSMDIVAC